MMRAVICFLWLAFGWSGAHAQDAASWSIGLVAHNIRLNDSDTQSHELGPNLELSAMSARPQGFAWLGHPQAYVELSANLHGDTSFAAAGLSWRWKLGRLWRIRPSFGLAVHDGALHDPYPEGDPRALTYARDHQLLGTRTLFRDGLDLEHDVGGNHAVGLVFEHLSNGGGLFGHRDNQSLNELGLRYTTFF